MEEHVFIHVVALCTCMLISSAHCCFPTRTTNKVPPHLPAPPKQTTSHNQSPQQVINVETTPGTSVPYADIKSAIETHKPAVFFVCQGESSTGVHQSMAGLGDLCRKNNSLLLVDTVCSLGGVPFFADDWGVDAVYSGSQKCLGGPPGAAPLMFGERAMAKLQGRASKVCVCV